jgi:hypothetical protein
VEKSNPIICAASAILAKIAQSKQSHIRRKFAQSGHPGSMALENPKKINTYLYLNLLMTLIKLCP